MTPGRRYEAMFDRLAGRHEGAFVPFTVLGDPDPATSVEIVRSLARSSADALELGIPFSDPVADGPEIQAATGRALSAGMTVDRAWSIVSAARQEDPEKPIGLLVYANLALHAGAREFCRRAAAAGVDSLLVTDAPMLESKRLERAALEHGIAPVLIAPPNAPDDGLREIAARSRGYVYVTARPGVTGVDRGPRCDAAGVIRRLRELGSAPSLLGFGIADPGQVAGALAMGAAGAIAGSAVVALVKRHLDDPVMMLDKIAAFIREMKQATKRTKNRPAREDFA